MTTTPQKANELIKDFIAKNYDLCVAGTPIIYDIGTQYCEGYTYTMPTINTALITLPND